MYLVMFFDSHACPEYSRFEITGRSHAPALSVPSVPAVCMHVTWRRSDAPVLAVGHGRGRQHLDAHCGLQLLPEKNLLQLIFLT